MSGYLELDAVRRFIEPLRRATACLEGHGQLAISRKGDYRKGRLYSWELNGGTGMRWPGIGLFTAGMSFEIVDADPEKHDVSACSMRVTTRAYNYAFRDADGDPRWRFHWHPEGNSDVVDPHMHRLPEMKQHWATPRWSLENAVRWVIAEGAPLALDFGAAENRLVESEATFRLFGSWMNTTDAGYPLRQR